MDMNISEFCNKIFESPKFKYVFEENRLKTFKNWVFSDNDACNKKAMAEAGFVFSEEPDCVYCFMCHKALDGWESTDNPWEEHVNHAPQCNFAKRRVPESQMLLEDFLKLQNEFAKQIGLEFFNELKEKTLKELRLTQRNLKR